MPSCIAGRNNRCGTILATVVALLSFCVICIAEQPGTASFVEENQPIGADIHAAATRPGQSQSALNYILDLKAYCINAAHQAKTFNQQMSQQQSALLNFVIRFGVEHPSHNNIATEYAKAMGRMKAKTGGIKGYLLSRLDKAVLYGAGVIEHGSASTTGNAADSMFGRPRSKHQHRQVLDYRALGLEYQPRYLRRLAVDSKKYTQTKSRLRKRNLPLSATLTASAWMSKAGHRQYRSNLQHVARGLAQADEAAAGTAHVAPSVTGSLTEGSWWMKYSHGSAKRAHRTAAQKWTAKARLLTTRWARKRGRSVGSLSRIIASGERLFEKQKISTKQAYNLALKKWRLVAREDIKKRAAALMIKRKVAKKVAQKVSHERRRKARKARKAREVRHKSSAARDKIRRARQRREARETQRKSRKRTSELIHKNARNKARALSSEMSSKSVAKQVARRAHEKALKARNARAAQERARKRAREVRNKAREAKRKQARRVRRKAREISRKAAKHRVEKAQKRRKKAREVKRKAKKARTAHEIAQKKAKKVAEVAQKAKTSAMNTARRKAKKVAEAAHKAKTAAMNAALKTSKKAKRTAQKAAKAAKAAQMAAQRKAKKVAEAAQKAKAAAQKATPATQKTKTAAMKAAQKKSKKAKISAQKAKRTAKRAVQKSRKAVQKAKKMKAQAAARQKKIHDAKVMKKVRESQKVLQSIANRPDDAAVHKAAVAAEKRRVAKKVKSALRLIKTLSASSSQSPIIETALLNNRATAATPPMAKPLISKSAQVRAKLERGHLEASEKKRVRVTIAKAKYMAVKEHTSKTIGRAKAAMKAKAAKAHEKATKYVLKHIADEKRAKARVHAANSKTYAKIKKTYAKIKLIKKKVQAKIKLKRAKLDASLKAKMAKLKASIAAAKAKRQAKLTAALAKVTAQEVKRKAAQSARMARLHRKMAAIRKRDADEKHSKAGAVATKFAAKLAVIKAKAAVKRARMVSHAKAHLAWMKTHFVGAGHVNRLARRARRKVLRLQRVADRKHRRKMRRHARRLKRLRRSQTRGIRSLARAAYHNMRKLHKERAKKHKLAARPRARVMSRFEKQAQQAEFTFGAADKAADLAWEHAIRGR